MHVDSVSTRALKKFLEYFSNVPGLDFDMCYFLQTHDCNLQFLLLCFLTEFFLIQDTCRCHMFMSTNWWKIGPYIDLTKDSELTGVFPTILREMVTSCCQWCRTHEITEVNILTESSVKDSLKDVRNNISMNDLSFPVYGSSDQDKYSALYGYVPIISSPGEVYVVNREPVVTNADILIAVVLTCWPIVVVIVVFSLLAGIIIWFLVSKY